MRGVADFLREVVAETKSKPQNKSEAIFASTREVVGTCPSPMCGKNVVEQYKSYSCESGKGGCGFTIWKKIAGKSISVPLAKVLLSKGKSRMLKGFKSKSGKPFEAMLVITEKDGAKQVGFEFAEKMKNDRSDI